MKKEGADAAQPPASSKPVPRMSINERLEANDFEDAPDSGEYTGIANRGID